MQRGYWWRCSRRPEALVELRLSFRCNERKTFYKLKPWPPCNLHEGRRLRRYRLDRQMPTVSAVNESREQENVRIWKAKCVPHFLVTESE